VAAVYYLTGPDGSGKTAFLEALERHFLEKGEKTAHVWMRSPKILSKPLMAYCRFTGLTKYKTGDGIRYGGHEFYRSKFVSWIFPWLQLIDFRLSLEWSGYPTAPDAIILIDRFSLDTLADLMADTRRWDLHQTYIGKAFLRLIPENTKITVIRAGAKTIRARKADTLHDPLLNDRIKAFDRLQKDLELAVLDNNRNFAAVKRDLFRILSL
jgi:thymidylate kinase